MTTEITGTRTRTRVRAERRPRLVRAMLAVTGGVRRASAETARIAERVAGTVTPAGWLVVAVTVLGLVAGFGFGWMEWLAAGVVAAVLIVLSIPFLFGARDYDVELDLAHDRVVAGGAVTADVRIRNHGTRAALPGRLDLPVGEGIIEVGIPLLRPGHAVTHPVEIPTPHRGVLRVGPATAVRTDPIGLLRREHAWDDVHDLFVHPRTAAVPATSAGLIRDLEGSPTRRLVDSDMSFHAIREYAPGDSRRQVHWKSTAKTGRLMVRQFEESRRSRIAIALDLAEQGYASDDEFEMAVSAAASLGAQALREGRETEVVTGTSVPRVVRGRLRAIREFTAVTARGLLDEFCTVRADEATVQIEDVCRLQAEQKEGLSVAFVVCGSATTLERVRRAALGYSLDTAVVAIVCDLTATPRVRPVRDLTVVTIGVLDDLPALLARGAAS